MRGLHVLSGKPRHGGAGSIVKAGAVHAHEEAGVAVHFDNTIDSPLIEIDVLQSGKGHKAVRQERDGVDARLEFRLVPAIVVLRGSELERFPRLGPGEVFIPGFARKKPRQNRMVRLANQDQMIALLLNDHGAALVRSAGCSSRLLRRARSPGGGHSKQFCSRPRYFALTPLSNPAPSPGPSRPKRLLLKCHPKSPGSRTSQPFTQEPP